MINLRSLGDVDTAETLVPVMYNPDTNVMGPVFPGEQPLPVFTPGGNGTYSGRIGLPVTIPAPPFVFTDFVKENSTVLITLCAVSGLLLTLVRRK